MADKNIKGITIEIGGDTTGLDKALSSVNKKSKDLQSELKQVENLLKFNPGNSDLLAQKQKLLADQIAVTSDKLKVLKEAQAQVDAQFASGKISPEQYRAFQRELVATQGSLDGLKGKLASVEQEQSNISNSTKQLETLFKATGTSVDNFSSVLGGKLTNAIKSGTASSKQLDDAINKIGTTALGTNVDLDKMKQAISSVDDGNSIKNVKKELNSLSTETENANDSVNELGDALESVAGALVAGGGLAGAVETALERSSLNTKIDITFDVPESSKATVKDAINTVSAYGVDAEAALEGVRRQWALNKDASDSVNASIVKGAAAISQSFSGIDFNELIQENNEVAAAIKISNQEALGLINSLLKAGFPPEQLDTIAEYGTQMKNAGFSAKEIQAIFEKGIDVKSWNVDNLNDGVKEARIRMAEFGQEVPKAMSELLSKTNISSEQLQKWGKSVAKGGKDGSKAMGEMSNWLLGIKDKTLQNSIATQIFGTMWEDQGTNLTSVLSGVANATDKTKQNQEQLNDAVSKLDNDPAVKFKDAMGDLKNSLDPVLSVIASVVSSIAGWIQNNPTLAATIAAIATTIGILVGGLMALAPIVTAIITAMGTFGLTLGSIAAPIGIIIASIAGLVAAGIALWKNWDSVKAFLKTCWEGIKSTAQTVWNGIKSFLTGLWNGINSVATTVFNAMKTSIITVWNGIKSVSSTVWNAIKTAVLTVWNLLKTGASTVFNGIKSVITNIWNGIKSVTSSVWNGIKSVVTGIWSGIKSTTTTVVNGIKSVISNVFNSFKEVVSTAMSKVKSAIETGWNKAKSFLEKINLITIGKNIIQGLIDGITSVKEKISSAVRKVADAIPEKFKQILGIHSPSKVMKEKVGYWITEGIAKGIEANTKAEKAAKAKAQAIIKSFNADLKNLKLDFSAGKINTNEYINGLNKLKQEYKNYSIGVKTIDVEMSKSGKKLANEKKAILADKFRDDKTYYANKSKLDSTSLQEELNILNKLAAGYKKNSDERIYFENLAKQKKEEITSAKKKIDEDYLANVKKLNADYLAEEKRLTEEYRKAVDDRANSLYSFAGLFDEVTQSSEVSGQQLIANLQGQVDTFRSWADNLKLLGARGIDEGLLAELQAMGPQSAAQIAALTTLSDEQLAQYVTLWQTKSNLARTQAVSELEGMRIDTANQITELRKETNSKLDEYRKDWETQMKSVVGTVKNVSKLMPSTGANVVQGLIDGIRSKKSELEQVMSELAAIVAGTVQSDLDMHSPSRVFKGFGVNVNEGFIQGLQQSAARLKNVMQDVYGSLASNAQKVTQTSSTVVNNNKSIDQSKNMKNTININTTTDSTRSTERMLRRLSYEF